MTREQRERAKQREPISSWTIYDHPFDYPNSFVARRFLITGVAEPVPTGDVLVARDIDMLRMEFVRRGLTCFTRAPSDDPRIVETWL